MFKCDLCLYQAPHKWVLNRHRVVHSDKKPFACSFPGCDFRSCWQGNLKARHVIRLAELQKKLGSFPFSCDNCDAGFYNKSALGRHLSSCTKGISGHEREPENSPVVPVVKESHSLVHTEKQRPLPAPCVPTELGTAGI